LEHPITGLNAFKPEDRPPVNIVFQTYHLMVAIGFTLIGISLIGLFLLWQGKLFSYKWFLNILAFSVLLPQAANQLGWISAEVGRQPWIVYGLLRTSDALSKAVNADQVLFSLIMFVLIYTLLFVLFLYLLNEKIKKGPDHSEETSSVYYQKKQSMA
jgi:cytochrome d ubiquinol oxidase subunit I